MLRFHALLVPAALSFALGCGSSKSELDAPGASASAGQADPGAGGAASDSAGQASAGAGAAAGGSAGRGVGGAGGAASGSAGRGAAGGGDGTSAGGTGGGAGKSGVGGASTAGDAGGPSLPTPCENETEREAGSGTMQCDNGLVHRAQAGTCAAHVASTSAVQPSMSPDKDECLADADCDAKAYGYCVAGFRMYGGPEVWNTCRYGCTGDAECDGGSICVCGTAGGDCHPGSCSTDGDCGAGAYCAEYSQTCTTVSGFSCQQSSDECELSSDCGSTLACGTRTDGTRFCTLPYCAG